MRHLTSRRCAAVAATALFLGSALSACGSSDDKKDGDTKSSASDVTVLSEPEATTALLTEGNLGNAFTTAESDSNDDDAPGCMSGVGKVLGDDDTAETTSERDFDSNDQNAILHVSNKVLSYKTEDEAKAAIADVTQALKDCDAVKETDADGITYDLEVTSDSDTSEDDVDEQVNALASGRLSATDGSQGNVELHLALIRVKNNITAVTVSAVETELPGDVTELVTVIDGRLHAVMEGKQPDDSVVAGG